MNETDLEVSQTRSCFRKMPLEELAVACRQQANNYQHGRPYETASGYELFFRAIEQHDQLAWEYVYMQYEGLVRRRILSHSRFQDCGENVDVFVNQAFERFWRYFSLEPGRFKNFANLPSLLGLLITCACTAIQDYRTHEKEVGECEQEWLPAQPDEISAGSDPQNEQTAFSKTRSHHFTQQTDFWLTLNHYLQSEKERTTMIGYYMYNISNQELYELYPHVFDNARDVFNTRANILERLTRNPNARYDFQNFTGA